MGLLSEGTPLSWEESKRVADHVRKHGIIQFINQYNKLKDRSKDCLLWGDEVIEYMLVNLNDKTKKAALVLNAQPILEKLMEDEYKHPEEHQTTWRPEYASYMVEGTPGKPYGPRMSHFNVVEANMRRRREEVMKLLSYDPNNFAMTLSVFPRIGCANFTIPQHLPDPINGVSRSLFFPDEAIFGGHPRFRTLSRNVRERRKERPAINVPIFNDKKTKSPFIEDFTALYNSLNLKSTGASAKPDHIYMDCMGFGMGCCCLQVTFQACNICEARLLYDQLTPLCPIMLALSASSAIFRGYLSDIDCRWPVISASVDDRTREERGLEPLKNERFVIQKSRYDSIDSYLSYCSDEYNDINMVYDKDIFNTLTNNGIDRLLAKHIAHLFIRDPISVFKEKLDLDDEVDTDHFENIQSTNWQTMRFKPPPPNTDIGWRVEFRPMEVQLTDFENAAYVVFIVLLTRVILTYKLNFVIPISKACFRFFVDENMKKAQKRDACRQEKFYFRKDIVTSESLCCCPASKRSPQDRGEAQSIDDEYDLFTIQEIISGKEGVFPGLMSLIERYLQSVDDCDVDTSCTISQYLDLIKKRASGNLLTLASWTREFVESHPDYQHDSIVPDSTAYDLLKTCSDITFGHVTDSRLLNDKYGSKSNENIPPAMTKVDAVHANMASKQQGSPMSTDCCSV
ncbi:hypothetical protein HELRODRAFT_76604 [Helobdella robusta]|uniref:Glutamate--cysteine ligase n=1 Tax=Helobdella robusta TaxID=6412 RepID=T1G2M2_HELRO|nr:hypothetical protein HELRODRAFT_76604 [Helobdella robusta]ESO07411.1 hypothetical protein HELRODRAFT_76604 [Helobdella robusta]